MNVQIASDERVVLGVVEDPACRGARRAPTAAPASQTIAEDRLRRAADVVLVVLAQAKNTGPRAQAARAGTRSHQGARRELVPRACACPGTPREERSRPRIEHRVAELEFALWRTTVMCHACGTANDAGRKFCGECGAPLTSPARPAARRTRPA